MKFAPRRRAAAEINLTPLIDILFLVLVFLVVTATFADRSILRIALPSAASAERPDMHADAIVIVIDADGTLYLDDTAQELDAIAARLTIVADTTVTPVTVAADERTPHGRVVEVVDAIRLAGIYRLDLQTIARPRMEPNSRPSRALP